MSQLGLSDPLIVQYLHWMRDIASGSFGHSFFRSESVADMLLRRELPKRFPNLAFHFEAADIGKTKCASCVDRPGYKRFLGCQAIEPNRQSKCG